MNERTKPNRPISTQTNSTEQSPSWEANSHSASQIPHLLWKPQVYYHFTRACHWSLHWATRIQSTPSHLISLKNHSNINIILPSIPRSSKWSLHATCPASHSLWSDLTWLDHWWSVQVGKLLIMQSSPAYQTQEYQWWEKHCPFINPSFIGQHFSSSAVYNSFHTMILLQLFNHLFEHSEISS